MVFSHSPIPGVGALARKFCYLPLVEENFLTVAECALLIALTLRRQMDSGKLVSGSTEVNIRKVQTTWLNDGEADWFEIKLAKAISSAQQTSFPFDISGFEEGVTLLRYDGSTDLDNQGFYDWHVDISQSDQKNSRKLTAIVQLSAPDDYEGGDLMVNYDGAPKMLSKGVGNLLIFPSFMLHKIAPVTSGIRYSVVTWAHGPVFQ